MGLMANQMVLELFLKIKDKIQPKNSGNQNREGKPDDEVSETKHRKN